jgi:RNA-directed DNA polymerase
MDKATIKDFQSLNTLKDLAYFLGFAPKRLSYILYKLGGGPNGQYSEFKIKKRSGGQRTIAAPHTGLKEVQKKLAVKLQDIYMAKKPVHGFVRKRTILTNAQNHSRKKYLFNIDLKDFFPSIHFGRVKGLFIAKPYALKREVAILITKISCFNDVLPQGSPCSPVISNLICAYMDKQLGDLAKDCGCFYTRYADDLTFSTNRSDFPEDIAVLNGGGWEPSPRLLGLITAHSFEVNEKKTSMRTRSDRQLVTGIVVNEYPNVQRKLIKQVRSMLHDWKVNGLDKAQEKYVNSFDLANRVPSKHANVNFPNVVRGKLEHIRQVRTYRVDVLNKIEVQECIRQRIKIPRKSNQLSIYNDRQYYKYFNRFEQLSIRDCGVPTVLGEGETDWMHLRKAFKHFKGNGDYSDLYLNIHKQKEYAISGQAGLVKFCNESNNLYVSFPKPVICVFDSDILDINKKHAAEEKGYIDYGNNVYSIVLPRPPHRTTETFAIEQLYKNADLQKSDKHGRRIFLTSEFDYKTGRHKDDPTIEYGKRARDGKSMKTLSSNDVEKNEKVLDSLVSTVVGGKRKSLALSKMDFAIKIMREEAPFTGIDYSGFKATFDLIQKICSL